MIKSHCQICAREIKARTGVIAHHGYQRPGNGWQTSSCLGARYLPYEESRDRIPEVKATYEGLLTTYKARLEDTLNNPPEEITENLTYRFNEAETYQRPENFDKDKAIAQGSFRHDELYEMEYRRLVKDLRTNINGIKFEIEFLQKRYDDWSKA